MKTRQIKANLILCRPLFVLILTILCLSCSKDQNLDPNDTIIGKWEWIETFNAWTDIKYTPYTEGYTQTSIYKNDNTVEYYKNGYLVGIESYLIRVNINDAQDPNSVTAKVLVINEIESPFSITNDTLIISQAYVDGPASVYKRIE